MILLTFDTSIIYASYTYTNKENWIIDASVNSKRDCKNLTHRQFESTNKMANNSIAIIIKLFQK